MASNTEKAAAMVLADLEANGPSTPLAISRRIHRETSSVWRSLLRMANAGQITFDETGRTASLTPTTTTDQEPTT